MTTYSFISISCSLVGPTGSAELGYGAAVAEEGITVEMEGDKNTTTMGADGEGQHNLHAAQNGVLSIRLLKTSPMNAVLSTMYSAQTVNPLLNGLNFITVRDPNRGDLVSAQQCAFTKFTGLTYAKDGAMNEWKFNSIKIYQVLGTGTPANS